MQPPQTVFDVCVVLGIMILFTLFVEWFVGTYILPRIHFGIWAYILVGILALTLMIFGFARRGIPADSQDMSYKQAANAMGLVAAGSVIGGGALALAAGFLAKRISPFLMAGMIAAFFVLAVIAYMLLRSLIAPQTLTNNDLFFASVFISMTLVGVGSIAFRPILANEAPVQRKYNAIPDPLQAAEKRRQRLNKKRSR